MTLPDTFRLEAWRDPVVENLGHDPRSDYAETYWLGILGPSALWAMRSFVRRLEALPAGVDVDTGDFAATIGLRGQDGGLVRLSGAFARLARFDLTRVHSSPSCLTIQSRLMLPPLSRAQVDRLPVSLKATYAAEARR